jgi:hypothetical protein
MTKPDAITLLRQKCDETSQADVARALGYNASTINMVLKGTYPGSTDNVLQRVIEVYGGISVNCPILGDIPLARCAEERKKPFAATNQQRIELYRACKTCERSKK